MTKTTSRRDLIKAAAVGSVAAGLGLKSHAVTRAEEAAQNPNDHEHHLGPVDGPYASATVSFGAFPADPDNIMDRSPNRSPNNRNVHLLIPHEVTIKEGGTVNFLITGFHWLYLRRRDTTERYHGGLCECVGLLDRRPEPSHLQGTESGKLESSDTRPTQPGRPVRARGASGHTSEPRRYASNHRDTCTVFARRSRPDRGGSVPEARSLSGDLPGAPTLLTRTRSVRHVRSHQSDSIGRRCRRSKGVVQRDASTKAATFRWLRCDGGVLRCLGS